MRFLQIEWHNHERARNAWDIERAEMKAKIAKQEGDCRSAKRLNEQLDKQVRMLEKVIRDERAKIRALQRGDASPQEEKKEDETKAGLKPESKAGMNGIIRERHLVCLHAMAGHLKC
jgi:striatin 1/3/4